MTDQDKEFEEWFDANRYVNECPMCSDRYHGSKFAWNYQQEKIDKLKAENERLRKEIETIKEER